MKIKAWIKEPGKKPYFKKIENELHPLQTIVGGFIEAHSLQFSGYNEIIMIVNEEGKLQRLEPNFYIWNDLIVGTAIFVSTDGEDFTDTQLTEEDLRRLFPEMFR